MAEQINNTAAAAVDQPQRRGRRSKTAIRSSKASRLLKASGSTSPTTTKDKVRLKPGPKPGSKRRKASSNTIPFETGANTQTLGIEQYGEIGGHLSSALRIAGSVDNLTTFMNSWMRGARGR